MVDDETLITNLIARVVTMELQAEAVQASSAERAIAELEKKAFSLVISDIRMPGIGGIGLLEWIQTHRPTLKERFLFVTGCAGGPAAQQAVAKLGVPVIEKPFSCANLVDRCRDLLAKAAPIDVGA